MYWSTEGKELILCTLVYANVIFFHTCFCLSERRNEQLNEQLKTTTVLDDISTPLRLAFFEKILDGFFGPRREQKNYA